MNYIDRIKQIKSERKITNDKLSEMTGIPLGTLSKMLAGISDSPKLSNVAAICDALGCSIDYIVNGVPENRNNFKLSEGEIRLVENYRKLDDHGREITVLVLEKECERITRQKYAPEREDEVAAVDSGVAVKSARIYPMAKSFPRELSAGAGLGKRAINLYDLPVSAGPGVYLDDSLADEISIPKNEKTESVSYALRISGNSMEPKYRDGDILLVEDTEAVEIGELGIFVLDGNGYFKKYGGDRLISLNEEYGDILLRDYVESVCCGRVVGKLKRK